MSAGEGKGWAKGKTAATDGRIASAAAAHRGMTYVRRTPPEHCRWTSRAGTRTLPLEWSPTMAYVVGLMATDGCLITGRTQLNFKSKDRQLVETFLGCLGRPVEVTTARTKKGRPVYLKQFGDAPLYRWLQGVGLTPRKSLTLGSLAVPSEFILHCARGLLDGDGSIVDYWYDGTGKARGRRYEALRTQFVSGSKAHLEWLQVELHRSAGVRGFIAVERHAWALCYAIRESAVLLPKLYPTADVPCLRRKLFTRTDYADRHGLRVHARVMGESRAAYVVA